MKVREVFSEKCVTTQPVDFADLSALTARLMALADELNELAPEVAKARVVREAHGDRMKRALACEMRQSLLDEVSAAKAEALGRSCESYGLSTERLYADLHTAELALQRYDAVKVGWESVRSALAVLRATAGNLA